MTLPASMLRWGDVQTVVIQPTPALENTNIVVVSKQLVAANWRVPMSWNVLLFAVPNIAAGDVGNFTVQWLFSLGAGQTASTSIPLFSMGPLAIAQNGLVTQQQQLVPSSNLQIQARVIGNLSTTGQSNVYVGAFVAPNNAEPLAEEEFLRALRGEPSHHDEGDMRWMPMGFYGDLDPLKYGPR